MVFHSTGLISISQRELIGLPLTVIHASYLPMRWIAVAIYPDLTLRNATNTGRNQSAEADTEADIGLCMRLHKH